MSSSRRLSSKREPELPKQYKPRFISVFMKDGTNMQFQLDVDEEDNDNVISPQDNSDGILMFDTNQRKTVAFNFDEVKYFEIDMKEPEDE